MQPQYIKVFTPKFYELLEEFIEQQIDAAHELIDKEHHVGLGQQVRQNVMVNLYATWFSGISDAETVREIPEHLLIPEYVEYCIRPEDVGQPIIATMIPDTFTPLPMSKDKRIALTKLLEAEHRE